MSNVASAGYRGSDVRSDCWAEVELRASGGIELAVKSRVSSMYGEAIRAECLEVLQALGVHDCRLELDDAGALPYVIGARIEAAVRRASVSFDPQSSFCTPQSATCSWLPSMKPCCLYPTSRDRFRRSRLYLPGNEPKLFVNAGLHKPDGVILDLEDSVAPSEKDAARVLVRNALRTVDFYRSERMVRINQGETGLKDLDWIVPNNVHVVLIPKVERPEQVVLVDKRIKNIQGNSTSSQSTVFLMPIIESALGGIKAYEIAISSPNIAALAIGLEDYTADIGVQRTLEGRESFWFRSQVVNAARAAGVQPIDTVFSDVGDMEGLKQSVLEAKALGFDGKGCIHPRQISVVHQAFAPDPKEVEKARKIVAAFEEAQAKGLGVVSLGSKMIDPPVVKRALRTVHLADTLVKGGHTGYRGA